MTAHIGARHLAQALASLAMLTFSLPLAAQTAQPPPTPSGAAPAGAAANTGPDTGVSGGEEAFNNACRTCHSVKPGDNRLGPSLAGIVGRKAGGEAGFNSSQSLKNSGVTWDAKTLDAFVANPDAVIPGNNMKPYTGISDASLRAKIIAYLGGA